MDQLFSGELYQEIKLASGYIIEVRRDETNSRFTVTLSMGESLLEDYAENMADHASTYLYKYHDLTRVLDGLLEGDRPQVDFSLNVEVNLTEVYWQQEFEDEDDARGYVQEILDKFGSDLK